MDYQMRSSAFGCLASIKWLWFDKSQPKALIENLNKTPENVYNNSLIENALLRVLSRWQLPAEAEPPIKRSNTRGSSQRQAALRKRSAQTRPCVVQIAFAANFENVRSFSQSKNDKSSKSFSISVLRKSKNFRSSDFRLQSVTVGTNLITNSEVLRRSWHLQWIFEKIHFTYQISRAQHAC